MEPVAGPLLVATRSRHKLREIREILGTVPGMEIVDLVQVGIAESQEEDGLEEAETFSENALAKARYFQRRSGYLTVADDSGLVVDALGGRPGVRSRRFAPMPDAVDRDTQDRLNLAHLLTSLEGVPPEGRTARFVTEVALVTRDGSFRTFRGVVEGIILESPQGNGGFGYDPVFLHPPSGASFAQVPDEEKARVGHRGIAFRRLAGFLRGAAGHGAEEIHEE
ncbi:MAG: non-canonical purine NTP pyrophosphatase [Gemmatimonadales bacterium]|nr:MAG: non-canonical purine NTP pyrophosphatase [Gemmatimonadales bacterium]